MSSQLYITTVRGKRVLALPQQWMGESVLLADPLHAAHVELDAVLGGEIRHVGLASLETLGQLAEEVLEPGRRDDLQNPAGRVARVPERVPLVAGLEREVAYLRVDHVVAQQGAHPALQHVAPLVDAVMPVQRGAQRAGWDRVLDQREAAARLLAPDHEAGTAAAQLGVETVGRTHLAGALGY